MALRLCAYVVTFDRRRQRWSRMYSDPLRWS